MNKQQYDEIIKRVISSQRSNLQKMAALQNAFDLYVKEETDRIVAELEKIRNSKNQDCSEIDNGKCWEYSECYLCMMDRAIDMVKAGRKK